MKQVASRALALLQNVGELIRDYTASHPTSMFRRNLLFPSSWSKITPTKRSVCLAYSLNLMIEAMYLSETSIFLYQTTQRHIPEDITHI
jgi:hypothetical protein